MGLCEQRVQGEPTEVSSCPRSCLKLSSLSNCFVVPFKLSRSSCASLSFMKMLITMVFAVGKKQEMTQWNIMVHNSYVGCVRLRKILMMFYDSIGY